MVRYKPVEVSCENCGKKKFKKVSALRTNPKSFCDNKCLSEFFNHSLKINCKECGIFFKKKDNKKSNNHFCSLKCFQTNSIKPSLKLKCDNCLLSFLRKKNEIKKAIFHFCTPECFHIFMKQTKNKTIKPNNLNLFKKELIKFKKDNGYRQKAIERYGYKCQNQKCLLEIKNISLDNCQYEVDHINRDKKDNRIENLQVLCCYCHAAKTRKVNIDGI